MHIKRFLNKFKKEELIMNFEIFEAMYQKLWKLIYDLFAIFGIELADPFAK